MFANSYREARAEFRQCARNAGGELSELVVDPVEDLTIDIACFQPQAKHVLVVSSGLHGVEGFAGSAIQRQFLLQDLPDDLGVVLLHGLNPYGMHFLRRVNESNVDLNRNFLAEGEPYSGSSDGYKKLEPLLNRPQAPSSFEFFLPRALVAILTEGFPALKQAVVGGQYDFPQGLFFGGHREEKTVTLLREALPALLEGAEKIVHIDLHTGLGKSGDYALLVEAASDSDRYRSYREVFGEKVQPWDADEGVAYAIRGGFPSALQDWFGDRIEVLTCEFGTQAPLTVLKALSVENRVHHWGGNKDKAKARIMAAFCPESPRWRSKVQEGGAFVLQQALKRLQDRTKL